MKKTKTKHGCRPNFPTPNQPSLFLSRGERPTSKQHLRPRPSLMLLNTGCLGQEGPACWPRHCRAGGQSPATGSRASAWAGGWGVGAPRSLEAAASAQKSVGRPKPRTDLQDPAVQVRVTSCLHVRGAKLHSLTLPRIPQLPKQQMLPCLPSRGLAQSPPGGQEDHDWAEHPDQPLESPCTNSHKAGEKEEPPSGNRAS